MRPHLGYIVNERARNETRGAFCNKPTPIPLVGQWRLSESTPASARSTLIRSANLRLIKG